jgi:hypothetical protein
LFCRVVLSSQRVKQIQAPVSCLYLRTLLFQVRQWTENPPRVLLIPMSYHIATLGLRAAAPTALPPSPRRAHSPSYISNTVARGDFSGYDSLALLASRRRRRAKVDCWAPEGRQQLSPGRSPSMGCVPVRGESTTTPPRSQSRALVAGDSSASEQVRGGGGRLAPHSVKWKAPRSVRRKALRSGW